MATPGEKLAEFIVRELQEKVKEHWFYTLLCNKVNSLKFYI